jgi:hypothetical protein
MGGAWTPPRFGTFDSLNLLERGLAMPLDGNEIPLSVHLRGDGDGAALASVQFNASSLPLRVQDGKARDLLNLVLPFTMRRETGWNRESIQPSGSLRMFLHPGRRSIRWNRNFPFPKKRPNSASSFVTPRRGR